MDTIIINKLYTIIHTTMATMATMTTMATMATMATITVIPGLSKIEDPIPIHECKKRTFYGSHMTTYEFETIFFAQKAKYYFENRGYQVTLVDIDGGSESTNCKTYHDGMLVGNTLSK